MLSIIKKIKNIFFKITVICAVLLLFVSCSENTALSLNAVVNDTLNEKGIEKSKITKLCDFKKAQELYNIDDDDSIQITKEELQKFVDDILLVHEEMEEITDRNTVRLGDAIFVSYVVYYNSEIVANAESDSLLVGSGYYNEEFENAVIGAKVGEPFVCELKSVVDTEKYKKGDILKYNIIVESINYFVTYRSSDRYILDYYGFDNEQDFLENCKMRLVQQKRIEIQKKKDLKFLNQIIKECEFYIDKEELAAYSEEIVERYKNLAYISGLELTEYIKQKLEMSEDEFYDYCYNLGAEEVKRYLLVGAYTKDYKNLSKNQKFVKFCSMMGYDSSNANNKEAEYAFLERECIKNISQTDLYVHSVGYRLPFKENKNYTVDIYDSSNIYGINYSLKTKYLISDELQQKIILCAQNLIFGETTYDCGNNLYDIVITFKTDGENTIKVMIDSKNGFVSMTHYISESGYPYIVVTELTNEFNDLIVAAKRG